MSKTRQLTFLESWKGERIETVSSNNNARRGRARGGINGSRISKRGRGSGRGRGRSANKTASTSQTFSEGAFDDDDDDILCEQALSNFELSTNDVSKAFEEVNASRELPGFDPTAGDIWIYPTNKPVRDYQFNITKTALYHNTLVSLPTGLGKTFIAAVVMYNFHRWYPNNLVIFMAPTRPLVTQQLDACHNLIGIDPAKMVELTGQTSPKRREDLWKEKKVFFLTPQVLTSDVGRGLCDPEQVRCIVVDEAHKALGNHAFAQVISMVVQRNKCFRILALSATPGNDLQAVRQVLQNLLISRVELRSESSLDILPYTHAKQVETIVVPLDQHINSIYSKLIEIFQIYTGKLMKQNALFGRDGSSFTQFQLLKAREQFRQNQQFGIPNYLKGMIEVDFATCITLAHSIELLLVHGLRSFYSFLNSVMSKQKGTPAVAAELKRNTNLEEILQEVQEKLNISTENSFFDLSASGLFTTYSKYSVSNCDLLEAKRTEDYLLSHPKMRVLRDLVQKHFDSHSDETRIMIFSEYRDSVQEIGNMLNTLRPSVKPMVFLGQAKGVGTSGRGLRQKEQVQVVQSFKSGDFNVLVSTCVGEEGLDIGEVDMIICYDASKSPTRLVQRMGRTGRQREGKTIFLLTQGREQRSYYSSISQQTSINKSITDASLLEPFLYKKSPRMIPAGVTPQCYKMDIILSSEQKDMRIDSASYSSDPEDVENYLPEKSKPKHQSMVWRTTKPTSTSTSATVASLEDPVPSQLEDMEYFPDGQDVDLTYMDDDILGVGLGAIDNAVVSNRDPSPKSLISSKCLITSSSERSPLQISREALSAESSQSRTLKVPFLSSPDSVRIVRPKVIKLLIDQDENPPFGTHGKMSQNTEEEIKMSQSILKGDTSSDSDSQNFYPQTPPPASKRQFLCDKIKSSSTIPFSNLSDAPNSSITSQSTPVLAMSPSSETGDEADFESQTLEGGFAGQDESEMQIDKNSFSTSSDSDSPTFLPVTPVVRRRPQTPTKQFVFRKTEASSGIVPFESLLSAPDRKCFGSSKSTAHSSEPRELSPLPLVCYPTERNDNESHFDRDEPYRLFSSPTKSSSPTFGQSRGTCLPNSSPCGLSSYVLAAAAEPLSPIISIERRREREREGISSPPPLAYFRSSQDLPLNSGFPRRGKILESPENQAFGLLNSPSEIIVSGANNNITESLRENISIVKDGGYEAESTDSDDTFFIPSCVSGPSFGRSSQPKRTQHPNQSQLLKRESHVVGGQKQKSKRVMKKRKRGGNHFVMDEAVDDGNGSTTTDEDFGSQTEAMDTFFVEHEEGSPTITETQQVRYMKYTKDTPQKPFCRKKSLDQVALEKLDNPSMDDSQYEMDTFCVPNDFVEYDECGDFTQRMGEARTILELESPSSKFKKSLRSRHRYVNDVAREFSRPQKKRRQKQNVIHSSDSE